MVYYIWGVRDMNTLPQMKKEVEIDRWRREGEDRLQKMIKATLANIKLDELKFFFWKKLS